jgi:nitroreductase
MMAKDLPADQLLEKALLLACRASSLHNSQPWRWVVEDAVVHLFADR